MHEQMMNLHAPDHGQQLGMGHESHSDYTGHANGFDSGSLSMDTTASQMSGANSLPNSEIVESIRTAANASDLNSYYRFDPATLDPALQSATSALTDALMVPSMPPPAQIAAALAEHKISSNRSTPPVTTTMRFSHELVIPVQYSDIRGEGKEVGPEDQGEQDDIDAEGDPDSGHRVRINEYNPTDPSFNRNLAHASHSQPPPEYDPENHPPRRTRYSRPGQPPPPVAAAASSRRTSARQAAAQAAQALGRGKRRRNDEESGEDEVGTSPAASAPSPPWRNKEGAEEEVEQDPEMYSHLDRAPMYMISSRTGRLPLPVPIPNLIKKSRGRRVPTTPTGLGSTSRKRVKKDEPIDGAPVVEQSPGQILAPMHPETESIDTSVPPVPPPGEEVRGFRCSVPGCGKWFKRGEHLKRHVRSIHTNEKPHICPHPGCGKGFSRHDNLCQHMRVHKAALHAKPKKLKTARQADVDDDYEPAGPSTLDNEVIGEDKVITPHSPHVAASGSHEFGNANTPASDTVPPNPGSDYQATISGSAPGRRPRGKLADADLSIYKKTYTNVRRRVPSDP